MSKEGAFEWASPYPLSQGVYFENVAASALEIAVIIGYKLSLKDAGLTDYSRTKCWIYNGNDRTSYDRTAVRGSDTTSPGLALTYLQKLPSVTTLNNKWPSRIFGTIPMRPKALSQG